MLKLFTPQPEVIGVKAFRSLDVRDPKVGKNSRSLHAFLLAVCDRLSARQRLAACSWPTTISTLAASPSNREAATSGISLAPMSSTRVPGGVVHKLPADLREALIANSTALAAWKDITPLARNEFICWVDDAKQETTRLRRIRRTQEELEEGQRRPCCWPGCKHRERTGR
jgi:Bacteriocin-protection, YdeI or OmpD-Associated